ncbi:hypothetical protein Clacol_003434 [Clathrus columnatus]|uniref:Uncharacterized protein n=1 Tax=Clathrus columnatus TaxID=1419009 RepID=A0AAV5A3M6_9AGAM|nr:hypothetical protein Clacol_003434 [Clathrus columnatus]
MGVETVVLQTVQGIRGVIIKPVLHEKYYREKEFVNRDYQDSPLMVLLVGLQLQTKLSQRLVNLKVSSDTRFKKFTMDNDLMQLWRLVSELTEQLAQNRAITASLQAQAGSVNSAASHQGTGFALRRFNTHLSQEAYEAELEKLNNNFVQQNSDLQNENKQLASLLKEYEQTLENVMSKFRTHAHATQQHELSLTKHYESLLLSRETSMLSSDLSASVAYSYSLAQMSRLLRSALRTAGGEPPEDDTSTEEVGGYVEGLGVEDWSLERESELSRLEFENQELRRMLGLLPPPSPPLPALPILAHQVDRHSIPQSSIPLYWEPSDSDQNYRSSPHQQDYDTNDNLMLRRQPQGTSQSPLDVGPHFIQNHPPSFSSETPLVTRKYNRRGMNGTNNIFGTGNFIPGAGVESSPASAMGSTFRSAWQEQERMVGPLGSIHAQTVNMADNKGSWDGLSNIYPNKSWGQLS